LASVPGISSFELSVNMKVIHYQGTLEERALPSQQPTNIIFKKSKTSHRHVYSSQ